MTGALSRRIVGLRVRISREGGRGAVWTRWADGYAGRRRGRAHGWWFGSGRACRRSWCGAGGADGSCEVQYSRGLRLDSAGWIVRGHLHGRWRVGGNTSSGSVLVALGGAGGEARATFRVTAGETFLVLVGGRGQDATSTQGGAGGQNGGGGGATASTNSFLGGAGGGGSSDVRLGGVGSTCVAQANCVVSERIIVGGGGGGAAGYTDLRGGDGGGVSGQTTAYGNGGLQEVGGLGESGGTFGAGGLRSSIPTASQARAAAVAAGTAAEPPPREVVPSAVAAAVATSVHSHSRAHSSPAPTAVTDWS